jgi:hypothetical protein
MTDQLQGSDPSSEMSFSPKNSSDGPRLALTRQEIAALREGDIVYVRMVVRKPLGEYGTVHCRIHDEKTWRAHYAPVFPEHIVGIAARAAESRDVASVVDVRFTPKAP